MKIQSGISNAKCLQALFSATTPENIYKVYCSTPPSSSSEIMSLEKYVRTLTNSISDQETKESFLAYNELLRRTALAIKAIEGA